jgi:hypothetical protein
MIISHSRRFIFIHIHKAGGTSVEIGLDKFLSWNDLILGSTALGETMEDQYRRRFKLQKHSSVSDVETICGREIVSSYYLFSVVRHPLDRLNSLYNFVGSIIHQWAATQNISPAEVAAYIDTHPEILKQKPALTWPASRAFIRTKNFSEFIRNDQLSLDSGFHTQVSRLKSSVDGAIKGYVFKLEESAKWIPRIRQALGINFELPHQNKSELALSSRESIAEEDRTFIENYYAEDYAAFDY